MEQLQGTEKPVVTVTLEGTRGDERGQRLVCKTVLDDIDMILEGLKGKNPMIGVCGYKVKEIVSGGKTIFPKPTDNTN